MAIRFPAVDAHTVVLREFVDHFLIGKAPVPDRTTKHWNDILANVDGVYRIWEEVTEEDCGLNNSWSMK